MGLDFYTHTPELPRSIRRAPMRQSLLSRPPNDRRKIFPPCFSRGRLNQINLAIKGQDV